MPADGVVVVLTNVSILDANPYIRLWVGAMRRSGARLVPLNASTVWATGADRPDWVHLQWPEWAVGNPRRGAAARGFIRLVILLAIARVRGARVMVTAHNVWSHDGRHRRLEAVLWHLLGWLATDLHLLSAATEGEFLASHPTFDRATRRVIPHGNYEPVVTDAPSQKDAREQLRIAPEARVLLTFGALKSYKGVEQLLEAFMALDDADARLIVAGRVVDEPLRQRLEVARAVDARVIIVGRFLSDSELARFVRASDCVVLPYRRVLNSGSAIMALTLGRPVLLPRSPSFDSLREKVGDEWVSLYRESLTPSHLAGIRRQLGEERPDLSWCSWEQVADRLADLWRETARS